MIEIKYIKGDATSPQASGNKMIVHICNDIGRWGKGFVLAISKRWKQPELEYKKWYKNKINFYLGAVQFVEVDKYICIVNMIGQKGIKNVSKGSPIRYEAVRECLKKVSEKAIDTNTSVHMPRIGCGLAGGKWSYIEQIINETLCERDIEVFVYDL